MSPQRPRPKTIRILEAATDHRDQLHLWADVGGRILHFLIPPSAISDRKLRYGLAEVVIEQDDDQGRVERSIVDLYPDADAAALRYIFEEHLDRFEEVEHDWFEQEIGLRPSQLAVSHLGKRRFADRADLVRELDVGSRAPDPLEVPKTRRIRRKADGTVIAVERLMKRGTTLVFERDPKGGTSG